MFAVCYGSNDKTVYVSNLFRLAVFAEYIRIGSTFYLRRLFPYK